MDLAQAIEQRAGEDERMPGLAAEAERERRWAAARPGADGERNEITAQPRLVGWEDYDGV
jgi:hypothetical protein